MKYGIYREGNLVTVLHSTTVDEAKAKRMAVELSFDDRATYIVASLGPNTPREFNPFDPFRPRVIFRSKGL